MVMSRMEPSHAVSSLCTLYKLIKLYHHIITRTLVFIAHITDELILCFSHLPHVRSSVVWATLYCWSLFQENGVSLYGPSPPIDLFSVSFSPLELESQCVIYYVIHIPAHL